MTFAFKKRGGKINFVMRIKIVLFAQFVMFDS